MKVLILTIIKLAALLASVLAAPAFAAPVSLPPAGGQYDSQLGGAYPPPDGTQIISRDREDPPASGLYNICYINAFQTQPQDTPWWLANHPDLLLQKDGVLVEDPNWPGELLFDTSTPANRARLLPIVARWIDGCAKHGYDAIEADNLDSYSRSGDDVTLDDNLAFATNLAAHAHGIGLAFGQKNGGELGPRGRDAGFDFAIVESCQVYEECTLYTDVYGAHVLEIEYTDTKASHFQTACEARGHHISVIRRDRGLSMLGTRDYFYQTC